MSLAQGNNTPTRPRIEPGSPDPESYALTTRPVRPLRFWYKEASIESRNPFISVGTFTTEPRYSQISLNIIITLNDHKTSIQLDFRFFVSDTKRHRKRVEINFSWNLQPRAEIFTNFAEYHNGKVCCQLTCSSDFTLQLLSLKLV